MSGTLQRMMDSFFGTETPPVLPVRKDTTSEEYLDLMLEWGTINDIPDLVATIRELKQRLAAREGMANG